MTIALVLTHRQKGCQIFLIGVPDFYVRTIIKNIFCIAIAMSFLENIKYNLYYTSVIFI